MFTSPTGSVFVGAESRFLDLRADVVEALLEQPVTRSDSWQSLDTSASSIHDVRELLSATVWYDMPQTRDEAQAYISPDLPWAEGHFQERVAGEPVNPGEWHDRWPHHAGRVELHQRGRRYDHNYMERFWASRLHHEMLSDHGMPVPFSGYRFQVGDLGDVVEQLRRDPTTRQAYLPVWFPEDTGATSGQRVPCTLGYHFLVRGERLHLGYFIRSCEVYRHFTNDVYMAVRLAQWVAGRLFQHDLNVMLGQLTMQIGSLHLFEGDVERAKEML